MAGYHRVKRNSENLHCINVPTGYSMDAEKIVDVKLATLSAKNTHAAWGQLVSVHHGAFGGIKKRGAARQVRRVRCAPCPSPSSARELRSART
jgi:hypothetical protein